ncbi:hypothetical protein ACOMHN_011308 [Nucella lapillus]
MEIQIPVADQDTVTEGQPTDRTGDQTISDNWSQEGQASALTSRSHILSSVSQPTSHQTAEVDAENDGTSKDKDGFDEVDTISDAYAAVCGDTDPLDSENIRKGGDDDMMKDANGSEKSYTCAHSAAEEVADENLPDSTAGSDHQEGADDEDAEILAEEAQDTADAEQNEDSLETEDTTAEPCDTDLQEAQNGNITSSISQIQEDEGGKNEDFEKPESESGGKVFLTENDNAEEEGSDISDVRAETPDWAEEEEEEEGREVGSVSDEGEAAQKQDCVSMNSQVRPLTRSTLHEDIAPGQRAVVNTPVSYYTATDFNPETVRNTESRNTSHAGVESAREAAFQRAMTLMTSRCDSKQEGGGEAGLFGSEDASYGYRYPQYFYVNQRKPAPMPPLKAWKGYHGNVYFEPIQIAGVSGGGMGKGRGGGQEMMVNPPPPSAMSGKGSSGRGRRTLTATTRSQAVVPFNSGTEKDNMSRGDTHSATRSSGSPRLTLRRGPTSAKSAASSRSIAAMSQQHLLYLDKQAVAQPQNSAMQEELQVIEKQQSTGSLNIQPRVGGGHFPQDFRSGGSEKGRTVTKRSGASSAKFDHICRGSVATKLRRAQSGGSLGNSMLRGNTVLSRGNQRAAGSLGNTVLRGNTVLSRGNQRAVGSTELMIVGDRFAASSLMSPLLRTQTQFSLSSQRMTVNSPDLYGAFERLPPLEQVRISLRHMDAHGDDGFGNRVASSPYSTGTSVGVVEELKPFIKYSPDVRAQFNRQIKYY